MKTVYTAIPLALLAAVAQAKSQALGPKQSRDVASHDDHGHGNGGHDFLGDDSQKGDFLGDTHDYDFLGDGFNESHKHVQGGHGEPSVGGGDDGDLAPGFVSSSTNSPFGGPHNFNEQAGPDIFPGDTEIDDGINNDNIVITQVNSMQQAQAQEEDVNVLPPPGPHGPPQGGPGPVEHQSEQLPPQQHSEPKQAPPEEHYDAPAPPAYKPEAEPKVVTPQPAPSAYTSAPTPAYTSAPTPAHPSAHESNPERSAGEPQCPQGEDSSHPKPHGADPYAPPVAPKEVSKSYPEGNRGAPEGHPDSYHPAPANPFQPPQPPHVQPPYPFPHTGHADDDDDDYPWPIPHPGPYPGPGGEEEYSSYPAPGPHLGPTGPSEHESYPEYAYPSPPEHEDHDSYPAPPHPAPEPEKGHDSYPAPVPHPAPEYEGHDSYPAPPHPAPEPENGHDSYPAPVPYPSAGDKEEHGSYPEPPSHEDPPHGSYPLPDHDNDSGHYDAPHPAPGGYTPPAQTYREPSPGQPESDPSKPSPPGREYSKPPSQPFVPQVTGYHSSSARVQTTPAPSSARHASYGYSAHSHAASHTTTSCTFTSAGRKTEASSPTAPSPVSPSTFLGGASTLAAPGGFGMAVVGALAFLL